MRSSRYDQVFTININVKFNEERVLIIRYSYSVWVVLLIFITIFYRSIKIF